MSDTQRLLNTSNRLSIYEKENDLHNKNEVWKKRFVLVYNLHYIRLLISVYYSK